MAIDEADLRIALVNPSSHGEVQSLFTFHKEEGIGKKPPLAVLILATYLIDNGFTNTFCFDAQLDDLSPEQTVDKLVKDRPDVVGLTVWTDWWFPAWRTAQLLRQKLPDCTIVMGGPHCSVFPGESLEYSEADYVVLGDGEDVLLEMVRHIAAGQPVPEQPGLWRKVDGKAVAPQEPRAMVLDVAKVPMPDRTLLPFKRYTSVLNPGTFETTMITSRGCPYRCSFCKLDVQKVYARTAEQIVDEFETIAALGISDIQVYDDTFTWTRQRVIDICKGIIERGIKVKWAIRDRCNKADTELYDLMRRAGCYRIHYGVESGSDRILKEAKKLMVVDQAVDAVRVAKEYGFDTLAFYMFGFLDETPEEAQQTIDLAMKLNTDYAVFAVLIPYPGTGIYLQALERGILPNDFWREFTKHPTPNFVVPKVIEDKMDRETLISLKNHALRKYYFRPSRILREMSTVTSPKDVLTKGKMAMNIVTDSLKLSPRFPLF